MMDRDNITRTGARAPGVKGGTMETSASFEARSAPSSYPTISLLGSERARVGNCPGYSTVLPVKVRQIAGIWPVLLGPDKPKP